MFHTHSTLIEDINFIVSIIIRLNSKLGEPRREHKHDRRSLSSNKTSVIRCTKCEGYGHENYQCSNWNAKYMTLQELQNYIVYLKEVKRSVRQKLEVRREQQAKREREKAERTLNEMWEKARQERELKERKELEMREREQQKEELKERVREREARVQMRLQRFEMLEKARQVEKLEKEQRKKELIEIKENEVREKKKKEQQEKEEEERREKQEKESFLTPLTYMVETKSLKGDCNILNCCSHSHHDFSFSLGTLTHSSFFILMPREDLYIKEQWHKQWGEEKMIEKAATTWAKHEPDFNHLLVCLSYHENPKGFQGHYFSIIISMGCFPSCFTVDSIVVLKLFVIFCRFIFDPEGQSPSTLIIRDQPIP